MRASMQLSNDERVARPTCYRCVKPQRMCICRFITRVEHTTRLHVLQHPHERMHPFGTLRIARLGLSRLDVEVCDDAMRAKSLATDGLKQGAALLYTGPEARDLASLSTSELPTTLIVIDGTWSQAKSLYKANPELWTLPQVRLAPKEPGIYRIRREPALHCLSTLEAIVASLQILEPACDTQSLMQAFRAMIDMQIAHTTTNEKIPRRRLRQRRTGLPKV